MFLSKFILSFLVLNLVLLPRIKAQKTQVDISNEYFQRLLDKEGFYYDDHSDIYRDDILIPGYASIKVNYHQISFNKLDSVLSVSGQLVSTRNSYPLGSLGKASILVGKVKTGILVGKIKTCFIDDTKLLVPTEENGYFEVSLKIDKKSVLCFYFPAHYVPVYHIHHLLKPQVLRRMTKP